MAKGPIVTDSIKVFIADIYKKHPKWKAKEVRNVASSLLHDANPELPVSFPSLSTVQNVLAIVRKPKPIDPEDKPWSIGKSVQFNLSPEATADLLQIWAFCLAAGREFTIRQAKWACYLRTTSYTFFAPNNKLETYELYNFSTLYANRERISKALNNPDVDTSDLDVVLGLTHVEYTAARTTGLLDSNVFHGFQCSFLHKYWFFITFITSFTSFSSSLFGGVAYLMPTAFGAPSGAANGP